MTAVAEQTVPAVEPAAEDAPSVWSRRFVLVVAVVALAALALRLGYLLVHRGDLVGGDGFYYQLASAGLADGRGYTNPLFPQPVADAHHPPGWTTLLGLASMAGLRTWLQHQIMAAVLGASTVVAIAFAGRRVAGPRVGVVAAVIAAVYPGFWMFERELLSEVLLFPVSALVILLTYEYLDRASVLKIAALSALCSVAALVRSEQILLALALVTPLVLLTPERSWRERLGWLGVAVGVSIAVLAPWTLFNLGRFEEPVFLSTGLGNAMLAGSCPGVFEGERLGYFDTSCVETHPHFFDREQSVRDAAMRRTALDNTGDRLGRLPVLLLAREGRTWAFFRPFGTADLYSEWSRDDTWVARASVVGFWIILAAAVGGVVALRRARVVVWPLLVIVGLIAVSTALTFGDVRYRAGAQVALVILAAAGLDAMWRWRRPGRAPAGERITLPAVRRDAGT